MKRITDYRTVNAVWQGQLGLTQMLTVLVATTKYRSAQRSSDVITFL